MPARVDDNHPLAQRLSSQLARQPRLSHPAWTRDEDQCAATLTSIREQSDELGELVVPPGQKRGAAEQRRRKLVGTRRWIERGVVRENPFLQRAELGSGLDPDLLHQRRTCPAIGLERLRLATTTVERKHQLTVQVLSKRLLLHRRLELGHHVRVPAQRQLRLHLRLEGRPAPFLKPRDLGLRERLVAQVGERRTAPEPQSLAQRDQCALGIGVQLRSSSPQEVFEAVDVASPGATISR